MASQKRDALWAGQCVGGIPEQHWGTGASVATVAGRHWVQSYTQEGVRHVIQTLTDTAAPILID